MTTAVPALLLAVAVALVVGLPGRSALRLTGMRPMPAAGPWRLPEVRWPVVLGGAVAGVLLLGPGLTVLLTAGGLGGHLVARRRSFARAAARERRAAVESCTVLAGELRAGRAPADALAVAADLAAEPSRSVLARAAAAARLGGDVPVALLAPPDRPSAVPEVLRALAACWQVCSQTGSGLAAGVDRLADGLRAREAQDRAVAAALAGPRASGLLLSLLPLAGVALAAGLGARPVHVLLHTPIGLGCLVAGLALDALGLWWTARLVGRAASAR